MAIARSSSLLFALLALVACSRATAPVVDPPPRVEASSSSSDASTSAIDVIAAPEAVLNGTYMGRTIAQPMSYHGADWLDRSTRDAEQKPEHVLDVLKVREGQVVADVGCGSGYFTTHLAKRVGASGRVIATDLQPEMLDLLKKKLDSQKLGANVTSRLVTPKDAKLGTAELDLVLMVDVYHEVEDPPLALAQVKRALKPTGRLGLVEYRAEDPKVAIKAEHKTTLVQLQRELAANGFTFEANDESLPEQRIVTFKPQP